MTDNPVINYLNHRIRQPDAEETAGSRTINNKLDLSRIRFRTADFDEQSIVGDQTLCARINRNLFRGLLNWWGLGDYDGDRSVLQDSIGAHNGTWFADPTGQLTQEVGSRKIFVCENGEIVLKDLTSWAGNKCPRDGGKAYKQTFDVIPFPSGVRGGGVVGGSTWYDISTGFTFAIWFQPLMFSCFAPGQDFGRPVGGVNSGYSLSPWAPGVYDPGFIVEYGGNAWICTQETTFSTPAPPDALGYWSLNSDYALTWGNSIPSYRFAVCGDHVGDVSPRGWQISTTDAIKMYFTSELLGDSLTLSLGDIDSVGFICNDFDCSSFHPRDPKQIVPLEPAWVQYVITSDGTTVKTFKNAIQQDEGSAEHFYTSGSGIDFGFVDNNRIFSGGLDFLDGQISDAMLWNRGLSLDEVDVLHKCPSCGPRGAFNNSWRTGDPADDEL